MCGIFGAIIQTELASEESVAVARRIITTLAVMNSARGMDSTGMSVVNTDGKSRTIKLVQGSLVAINTKLWEQGLARIGPATRMVLGHTRKATHGSISVENTHPFRFGRLLGVHNGVITNHQMLNPANPFDNDSKNLFANLAEHPITDMPEVLAQVQGSYAIAMCVDGIPILAHNSGSPCWVSIVEDFGIIFSSISSSIGIACGIAGVDHSIPKSLPTDLLTVFSSRVAAPETYAVIPTKEVEESREEKNLMDSAVPMRGGVVMVPGLRCTINCQKCDKTKTETSLRLLKSRAICEQCYKDYCTVEICSECSLLVSGTDYAVINGKPLCLQCGLRYPTHSPATS